MPASRVTPTRPPAAGRRSKVAPSRRGPIDRRFLSLSAVVGAGLVFAGVTDTCGMAKVLGRLPWNRRVTPAGAGGPRRRP